MLYYYTLKQPLGISKENITNVYCFNLFRNWKQTNNIQKLNWVSLYVRYSKNEIHSEFYL